MENRSLHLRIGLMVVTTFGLGVILILLLGEGPELFTKKNSIQIILPTAPGIAKHTPIHKSGVRVGRVTGVELMADGRVLVQAEIYDKMPILKHEVCRVQESLLGDAELNFVPARDVAPSTERLAEGDTVSGVVAPDPIQVVGDLQGSLAEAIDSVAQASYQISEVARQISGMLAANERRFESIVGKTDTALDAVAEAVHTANRLLGDPDVQSEVRDIAKRVPAVLEQTEATLAKLEETFSLVDRNLQNLEGLTRPLGERGPFLIARVEQSAEKLDLLMDDLRKFSGALNSKEGSLGQLINDPKLYDDITRTVATVEDLSSQLRPIISDARVFSDQIARHPELLGLRGAMQNNSGTKGVPNF